MSRRHARPISALLLGCLALAGTLASQPAFAAAPRVTVSGTAPIPTTAPSQETVTYDITVGATVGAAVFTAHEPGALPADPASVQIDGTSPVQGTVTSSGDDLVVRLGVGANSSSGGQLLAGTVRVTFTIAVVTLPEANTTVSAELAYTAGGTPATAHSADVPLTDPDLSLITPPDSGEDTVLPLGTGVDGDFEAILQNSGADAASTTLTIDLPAGLTVDLRAGVFRDDDYLSEDDDGGVQLPCSMHSSAQVTCELGSVPNGTNSLLDIPVEALPSAEVGRVAHFTVSAFADSGQDADSGDNQVGASVQYTGTANLTVTLTPPSAKVVVTKKVRITAKVFNNGPQPALDALAIVAIDTQHFTIVHFSGATVPFARIRKAGHGMTALHHYSRHDRGTAQSVAVNDLGAPVVLWNVGTLKPRETRTSVVTLRALSLGRTDLAAFADSEAGQPSCNDLSQLANCKAIVTIRLTAIAAPKPRPKPRPSASASTAPTLAATGAHDTGPLLAAGLLLLLAGTGLFAIGSAHRRSQARH